MDTLEIDDLEMQIGPAGTSDSVVGIPCGVIIGVIAVVIFT
jgi:hypothetical protein